MLENATSLVLFDHSMKDTLLESSSRDAAPTSHLFDHTQGNDTSSTLDTSSSPAEPCETSGANFTTYFFFIFPIIGFIVLIMGGCLLRKRQVQQDAEAIRRYHERLSAAHAERKMKEERRNKLVERALVTTKVTFLPRRAVPRPSQQPAMGRRLANSFAVRGRSSTMETEVSIESSTGHTTEDLDSTTSSSCNVGGIVSDEEEGRRGELDIAEKSQQSASENQSSPALVLEHSTASVDLETCAICLEPYKENDDVSYSKHQNCSHAFHTSCILSWLKDEFRNDCPCCRGPYLHLQVVEDDGNYRLGGYDDSSRGANDSSAAESSSDSIANAADHPTASASLTQDGAPVEVEDSNV